MPFLNFKVEEQGFEQTEEQDVFFITSPKQIPVFMIPGIVGWGVELSGLALEILNQTQSERPIFIYQDSRLESKHHAEQYHQDLLSHAKSIGKGIIAHLPPELPIPCLIVGFSYGCTLAALTADYLKTQGKDPRLFLIDGPSPDCSQKYFSAPSTNLINDLIDIVNYAAKLANLKAAVYLENEIEILKNSDFNIVNTIDTIEKKVLSDNNLPISQETAQESFQIFTHIIKQNLKNLMDYKIDHTRKLDSITLLMTESTAQKYGHTEGGWEKWTTQLTNITNNVLKSQQHMDLLKKENALGASIEAFIKQEIPLLTFLRLTINAIFKNCSEHTDQAVTLASITSSTYSSGSTSPSERENSQSTPPGTPPEIDDMIQKTTTALSTSHEDDFSKSAVMGTLHKFFASAQSPKVQENENNAVPHKKQKQLIC